MRATTTLVFLSVALLSSSCTIVTANRVFPKPAWYWSADAKEQRREDVAEKQLAARPDYLLHDTVYDDYYAHGVWVQNRSGAELMSYAAASAWLLDFRTHERGEYSDSGPTNYPVVIERKP